MLSTRRVGFALGVSAALVALVHCGSDAAPNGFEDPSGADGGPSSSGGPGLQPTGDGQAPPGDGPRGVCGDTLLALEEECDDGNTAAGDGCSTACTLEAGWTCPDVGLPCSAAVCGDGILAGFEECERAPGATENPVGCSATCTFEPGYDCDPQTRTCNVVTCGDGIVQRGESCEETAGAIDLPFDGCYECIADPQCQNGICTPTCGDGQRFAGEACDDGNLRDGDGCSATCTIETGFTCTDVVGGPQPIVELPVLIRDVIGNGRTKNGSTAHPDFNGNNGNPQANIVLPDLDAERRPQYNCPGGNCASNPSASNIDGRATFDQWYRNVDGVTLPVPITIQLGESDGAYRWDSGDAAQNGGKTIFDPVGPSGGWVAADKETNPSVPGTCSSLRNVSFTSETHFWFEYQGGEAFEFAGDDDTWVFVNGKLAVDLGGTHGKLDGSFVLDADTDGDGPDTADGTAQVTAPPPYGNSTRSLGMTLGGVYEVIMFQAERNQCDSNFKVTLKAFNRPKSTCASTCGDGIVARGELCDDGVNDGSYGGCAPGCKARGPRCGDGVLEPSREQCDDGNSNNTDSCANNCTRRSVN